MLTLETEPEVRTVAAHQEERALAPLTLAFTNDPAARWMYADAHQFRLFFPRFARAFGGRAFTHGTAQQIGACHGTALWLPPGVAPEDEVLIPLIEETVLAERQPEVFAIFEQMGALQPAEPHWYLPLLGIDPRHQGRGLGSLLMGKMLAAIDDSGAPAYLEASNERNVPFYERLGFEVRGKIQAGDSPTLFAMLREPR